MAIIHARGGSKRVPLKNLHPLGGKPLLAYPIELCNRCDRVERIVVSTDHDGIMDAARRYGAEVPFRRPAELAEDVPSERVTLHALQVLLKQAPDPPEFVLTLTPATPFTRPEHLDEGFDLLSKHPDWDGVTTMRPATEHPEWMLIRDGESGRVRTLLGNSLDGELNVSQNLKPHYYPSGGFWINRTASFLRSPSLYGNRWGAVILTAEDALDLDFPSDFDRAEAILKSRPSQPE